MPGYIEQKIAELQQRQEELDHDRLHADLVEQRLNEQGYSGGVIPEAAIEDAYAHASRELKQLENQMPRRTPGLIKQFRVTEREILHRSWHDHTSKENGG